MNAAKRARLKKLIALAYWCADTPNELNLVRALGLALFGVDVLYEAIP